MEIEEENCVQPNVDMNSQQIIQEGFESDQMRYQQQPIYQSYNSYIPTQNLNNSQVQQGQNEVQNMKQFEVSKSNKDNYSTNSSHSLKSHSLKSHSSQNGSRQRTNGHKYSIQSNGFDTESSNSQGSGDFTRQVDYAVQPIYKQVFPRSFVHLFGDLIIHTDVNNLDDYIGINSPFNQIKKILQIQYKKQNKTLEILLDSTNQTYIDIDNLVQLFHNYPDQTIHNLSSSLQKYKTYALSQQKMIKICSQQQGFKDFVLLKQVKFERFKKAAQELIDQNQNEYLVYMIYQRNYETGGVEMKNIGINEKLINLLGSNVTDYEELVRRVGIYYFQNKYVYNYILSKYLGEMGQQMKRAHGEEKINCNGRGIVKAFQLEYQSTLLTLDDYLIETNNLVESYVDCSDEDSSIFHDMLKFRDMIHLFKIQVTDQTLQFLQNQRLSQQTAPQKDLVQKESLYYELEASIFLEKFYAPKQESQEEVKKKIQQSQLDQQKICGYRVVNQ